MAEEKENRKGFSIFYAVIGVATLVVAIIGATFAYFSANAEVTGGDDVITGSTNSELSNALSAEVTKITFEQAAEIGSNDLVPSDITATKDSINAAVNAGCVDDGYTGCHLYRIKATSTQAVDAVELKLATLTLSEVTKEDDWKYIIYKGKDDGETKTIDDTNESSIKGSSTFTVGKGTEVSLHDGGLEASKSVYYYLLIYVANQGDSQNAGDDKDVTGTYTGTVTFTAAGGGQVSATFSG